MTSIQQIPLTSGASHDIYRLRHDVLVREKEWARQHVDHTAQTVCKQLDRLSKLSVARKHRSTTLAYQLASAAFMVNM